MHSEYKDRVVKRIKALLPLSVQRPQTLQEPTSEAKYLSKTIKNVINKAVLEETEEVCVQVLRENKKT